MAVKVKILSLLLFVCLIDSLHSASYRRMKREVEAGVTVAPSTGDKEPVTPGASETPGPSSNGDSKHQSFLGMNSLLENVGQLFNMDKPPKWLSEAGSWLPNLFGKN